jgi:dihydrofolate reductase
MIIVHAAISVDGFIAGRDDDMSWTNGAEYDTSSDLAEEVARSTGAVLAGRGWYRVARSDGGGALAGIYGGEWSGPVVLVTHHPEQVDPEPGLETAADIGSALARAETLAGDKDVGVFGGDVARQVLDLGRLDEVILQVVPVVLGGGVPLFGKGAASRVELERVHLGVSGSLTDIRYRVV